MKNILLEAEVVDLLTETHHKVKIKIVGNFNNEMEHARMHIAKFCDDKNIKFYQIKFIKITY